MGKRMLVALVIACLPIISGACPSPDFHRHYFFEAAQKNFADAGFIARVRISDFQPAVSEEKFYLDGSGVERTRYRFVSAPKVTLEIIEILKGQVVQGQFTQELDVTSCSHPFATDQTRSEFVVAGVVLDSIPVIKEYRIDGGGLY